MSLLPADDMSPSKGWPIADPDLCPHHSDVLSVHIPDHIKSIYAIILEEIRYHHAKHDSEAVDAFPDVFEAADVMEKGNMLRKMKAQSTKRLLGKRERKGLGRVHRVELVKRNLLLRIAAAWVITVPVAAVLAAMFFFMIRGMMLP